MDYSLIPTADGILVRLGKEYLDNKVRLRRGLKNAHAFRDELQARHAIKAWVVS